RGADAAIGMASAGERAPLRFRAVHQVGEAREGADVGDGKPVTRWLDLPDLLAGVLRQMRESVALAVPPLWSNVLVASSKGNRLEADESNFLGIFHGELHHRPYLVVVHVVDDSYHQNDFNTGLVHVFDGPELDVKQVADLAVAIGVIADAIELQVGITQA